jgi:pimeloyl-ACP methyl ester carboxylesterase
LNFKKILVKTLGFYINGLSFIRPQKALRLGYKFFSEPRIGKHSQLNYPKVLQGVHYQMLNFESHQFPLFCWEGSETKILLVHGWESNAARWKPLLPYLQKLNFTIFALEAPAHGWSSGKEFNVPLYAQYIQVVMELQQPQFILGHSIGGAACLYHRYLYPNPWVKKMIILGAPSDLKVLIANYQKLLGLNAKVVNLMEHYFQKRFGFTFDAFSGAHFASNFDIPGMIAHDEEDPVVAFAEGQKIANHWKNATWVTTQGLGHSMHNEVLYQQVVAELTTPCEYNR